MRYEPISSYLSIFSSSPMNFFYLRFLNLTFMFFHELLNNLLFEKKIIKMNLNLKVIERGIDFNGFWVTKFENLSVNLFSEVEKPKTDLKN